MSTLKAVNIQHPSASTPAITLDSAGAMTGSFPYPNRNLLYNGAMQINQRSSSAVTFTNTVGYSLDRYRTVALGTSLGFSVAQSNTVPVGSGFNYSMLATVTSAKSPASTDQARIDQFIEANDAARLMFGTANAQAITLSFWVRSSVTGIYSIAVYNASSPTRSFVAQYTINSSNTWEKKTINITGDTTGSWASTGNGFGLGISFILGMGSNFVGSLGWQSGERFEASGQSSWISNAGATFYLTGIQLEIGSVATPFEFKSYGQDLRECQRYFEKSYNQNITPGTIDANGCVITLADGLNSVTRTIFYPISYKITKRATAIFTAYSTVTGAANRIRDINSSTDVVASISVQGDSGAVVYWTNGASQTSYNNQFHWTANAEL